MIYVPRRNIMKNILVKTAVAVAIGAVSSFLYAENTNPIGQQAAEESAYPNTSPKNTTEENMNRYDDNQDPIDVEDFVETASAKGIAEIETAKAALEKGSSEVHAFANKMIEDHRSANEKLAEIARKENVKLSDEATLMDKAKTMILEVRDGESFDEAYINNQVESHEDVIELFQRAAASDHGEISNFAKELLPKLQEHLQMANALKSKHANH